MSPALSGAYATPLQLELVPSRRLGILLAVAHGCALMLLPFSGLAAGYQLLLAVPLFISGWHAWRDCSAVSPGRCIRRLVWGAGDRVELVWCDGTASTVQLQPHACVTPWLVVLRLRDASGRRHHLPVLPDMLPGSQFRRLRVRLRLEVPRLAGSHT